MSGEVGSTYRVQLHADFTFDDVAALAPYLAELGITHVYCSPYLQAAPGSTHGYDVIDHTRLNEELGGRTGFERMVAALEKKGLSHIVDIVPNHVSTEGNDLWWDVLKHGRDSRYASWFDIDWDYLEGKICAPLLGDTLENCIERGELTIDRRDGDPVLRYFDHTLPLRPDTNLHAPLGEVIDQQHYWLVFWQRGNRNINYRRFFDISTLAAMQVQHDEVFEHTHRLILELIAEGKITGLRVDHIDGLWDPQGYLERLSATSGVPVWVEKILEPTEELRQEWPVHGTTGYDFMGLVGGLWVEARNEGRLDTIYQEFTGDTAHLEAMKREKKMLILRQVLVADVKRLATRLTTIFEGQEWETDEGIMMSLVAETLASLDVYRSYVRPDGTRSIDDERLIVDALETARRYTRLVPAIFFDRLGDVLLTDITGDEGRDFLLAFQQASGPVMAKSIEDTVFYNYNRLVSLNEVGGDPGYFGVDVDEFHEAGSRRAERWPHSMLATSTHDTKRSEDVRARISLLSEIPEDWESAVETFAKIGSRYRIGDLPDRNAEYLLYQTLVGAFPLSVERACAYMQKAAREAKGYTSWLQPNEDYERALDGFIRGLLADPEFDHELESFVEPLIEPGRINSLAQTLIRLTFPGVPDTYQGTEIWDLSLVDPDNRRPVDHDLCRALLAHVQEAPAGELWVAPDEGAPKLLVVHRALQLRNERPEIFSAGSYIPLEAEGSAADHVVAYQRGDEVAVVTPRLVMSLGGDWGDTTVPLPEGRWRHVLTDETVYGGNPSVGMMLSSFPVALLVRD